MRFGRLAQWSLILVLALGQAGLAASASAGEETPYRNILSLSVGPDRAILVAANDRGGLFCSQDQGRRFRHLGSGLPRVHLYSAAVAPDGKWWAAADQGLLVSSDQGGKWTQLGRNPVQFMAFTPQGRTWAKFWNRGLYQLSQDGKKWEKLGFESKAVYSLAFGPEGRVWAGLFGGGVQASLDQGRTWRPANSGLANLDVLSLLFRPDLGLWAGTFRGGLYHSGDQGNTWRPGGPPRPGLTVTSLAAGPAGELLAGTREAGVWVSLDRGQIWSAGSGLASPNVQALAAGSGDLLWAGTWGGGMYFSTDHGRTWRTKRLVQAGVTALAEDGQRRLWAAAEDRLFLTQDGSTWQALTSPAPGERVTALAFGAEEAFAGGPAGVFASRDGGQTWEKRLSLKNTWPIGLSATAEGLVVATQSDGIWLLKPAGTNQANLEVTGKHVFVLAPGPGGRLLAGTELGLVESLDHGRTWRLREHLPYGLRGLAWRDKLVVISSQNGTFAAWDGGSDFDEVKTGESFMVNRFYESAWTGDGRLVTAREHGVVVLTPGPKGSDWPKSPLGLANKQVLALAAWSRGRVLAGTAEGLFATSDNGRIWRETALPE